MGKIKRAGYIFINWIGDHPPKHVHVYQNGRLVLKFDQEARRSMKGKLSRNLLKYIEELESQGFL